MNRTFLDELLDWRSRPSKPILLTGARQTGKSFLVGKLLASSFSNLVEVNFEERPDLKACFEDDLTPKNIISRLEALLPCTIVPGKTLLFLDEAQFCPNSIVSLRYFREKLSELHVIAAGSLLDFALEDLSVPVGRVSLRHLTPLSFEEYLQATGNDKLLDAIRSTDFIAPYSTAIHSKSLKVLKEYLAIGGMPEVVQAFSESNDYLLAETLQKDILATYEADIPKYTKRNSDYKYALTVFQHAPRLVSDVLKFSKISRDIKSTYLRQGIELLNKAGVITLSHSASTLPLAASFKPDRYKLFFLDVGLLQRACNLNITRWLSAESEILLSAGMVAEQFIAQQILAHSNNRREKLFYWEREKASGSAELDFLIEKDNKLYPIEVKSGKVGTLKSMRLFLDKSPEVPFGIRVSAGNVDRSGDILSIPLYAFGTWLDR